MAEIERKSKGIDAPLCKICHKRHWGTCLNQTSGGYLSGTVETSRQDRLALAKSIVEKPPVTKRKNGKKRGAA